MIPYAKSITVKHGDTYELFFRVREKQFNVTTGEWEPGPYRDLTGWTAVAQVRDEFESTDAAMEFVCTVLDQVVTPGGVLLKLSTVSTGSVTVDTTTDTWEGVWDVVMIQPDLDQFTYIAGKFKVKPRVTDVS